MLVHSSQKLKASRQALASNASKPGKVSPGQSQEASEILKLQRTIGNQAVQRLLDSQPARTNVRQGSTTAGQPELFRDDDAPVVLTGVTVNHPRITVPPAAGLAFAATKAPAGASDVTFSLTGDSATIAGGTTIDSSSGAITVAADQTGGSGQVDAEQKITAEDGSWTTTTKSAAFSFTAIPTGISSTSAVARNNSGAYGGDFTHTFAAPGAQSALDFARVNELFAAASGTTLSLTGLLGGLDITVNDPTDSSAGWDLDSTGTMSAADHVTWSSGDEFSARPFIANASNQSPQNSLPQDLTATQQFQARTHPANSYGPPSVATTTHRRAFEMREDHVKAVTSAGGEEVVEDYAGPTVYLNARAMPNSIPATGPTPEGGEAPEATTTQINVAKEGRDTDPTFTIQSPDLGATIDSDGELTPGTTAGTVTVRAGDSTNYDETTVTLTAPPAAVQEGAGEAEGESE